MPKLYNIHYIDQTNSKNRKELKQKLNREAIRKLLDRHELDIFIYSHDLPIHSIYKWEIEKHVNLEALELMETEKLIKKYRFMMNQNTTNIIYQCEINLIANLLHQRRVKP